MRHRLRRYQNRDERAGIELLGKKGGVDGAVRADGECFVDC